MHYLNLVLKEHIGHHLIFKWFVLISTVQKMTFVATFTVAIFFIKFTFYSFLIILIILTIFGPFVRFWFFWTPNIFMDVCFEFWQFISLGLFDKLINNWNQNICINSSILHLIFRKRPEFPIGFALFLVQ